MTATVVGQVAPRRTGRGWLVGLGLLVVVVLAGVGIAAIGGAPAAPLDPASTAPDGSRALVRVLGGYGARVAATRSLDTALAGAPHAVVVTDPDAYSDDQLRRLLRQASRVVLVEPGTRVTDLLAGGVEPDAADDNRVPFPDPDCDEAGAVAAGPVDWRGGRTYVARQPAMRCYGGAVIRSGRAVVLGWSGLLTNDALAGEGVAALDVNLLSADRSARTVAWLRPGADAAGTGAVTVWDAFPDWVERAVVWLLVVGLLLVLWRARRLGPVVREPLPVVVRAAELTEGHGRLWSRAGARDRAAAALRRTAVSRLAVRAGLPRAAPPRDVAAAVAPPGRAGGVETLLAGPAPGDDAALVRLARDLARLEAGYSPTGRAGGPGDPEDRLGTPPSDHPIERTT